MGGSERRRASTEGPEAGHLAPGSYRLREGTPRTTPPTKNHGSHSSKVARLGLLKAVDQFDVDREQDFLVYATPTMTGKIKRYFRECNWTVRPPRRLQELRTQVQRATQRLAPELGRAPTMRDRLLSASLLRLRGHLTGDLPMPPVTGTPTTGAAPAARV